MRLISLLLLSTATLCAAPQVVMVEAESFESHGGWTVDAQFMDQMGSPFLLAHGLGVPVADASAKVQFPSTGTYKVWVRTRDWVAQWKIPGAPGKFQVLVNGAPLKTIFGTEGAAWHWQDGGTVSIPAKPVSLALHDLTGFDGRCDALLFARDQKWTPPDGPALASFRRQALGLSATPEDAGKFDFVVVGGGMAGTAAAVSAARLGIKVALIQNRPILGGNSSSEVRVFPGGRTMLGPNPGLGAVEHELDPGGGQQLKIVDGSRNARDAEFYADQKKIYVVESEKNIKLFLNTHALKVEVVGKRIAAVIARDVRTGKDLRFSAPLFADCTGDATIGYLAGADFRVGREGKDETGESLAPEKGDKQVMGTSYMWYAEDAKAPAPFPVTPWALEFNERTAMRGSKGDWDWEVGMRQDQVAEAEAIRDHTYRAIYGNWSFLKNHAENRGIYEKERLSWVAYVAGKRESRRLMGDVVLKEQDMLGRVDYPDGAVSTTWTIDLHYPKPENTAAFPGQEFRSVAQFTKLDPYLIPYRCFYSRNIENLFMAGRNISVTHVALGSVRVQRTTGMMGEVVGMGAALARQHDTSPRGVYQNHLGELKDYMRKGVGREDNVNLAAQTPIGFSRSSPEIFNWKPALASAAAVRVWLRILPDPKADRDAAIEIIHNGSKAVRRIDLTEGEARWLDLGVFSFTGNNTDFVRLVRHSAASAFQPGAAKFEVMRADAATVRATVMVEPK